MRKVLMATRSTQGQRRNDFSFTREGELVTYGFECDAEKVDGVCGCKRSLVGMASHRATTTFQVGSMDLSDSELSERIRAGLASGGWIGAGAYTPEEDERFVEGQFHDTVNLWNAFSGIPDGAVIERRGDRFRIRIATAA